ncbi:hypothetical protein L2E82_27375 [Cichorium intybus]|uniref:Uncharacterized protein n=1 Tax=Cichorium intybus TaxID=13427 RepID=A0ACB9CT42_CICIN|nr:hypothetical protein L2E82_27375 [Cichorium intybus]
MPEKQLLRKPAEEKIRIITIHTLTSQRNVVESNSRKEKTLQIFSESYEVVICLNLNPLPRLTLLSPATTDPFQRHFYSSVGNSIFYGLHQLNIDSSPIDAYCFR